MRRVLTPVVVIGIVMCPPPAVAVQETQRAPVTVFDYDRSAPLDIREVSRETLEGYDRIDLTYASPAGGRVPGYLFVPHGEGPFAGILLMHGMPGSRRNAVRLAERYVITGAVVLAITAPFSRPDDVPRQRVISLTAQDRDEQIQLIQDLRRGVDLLMEHPLVDSQRIGYSGTSYGGAMGGLLAGVEKRIKAYALVVGDGGLVAHLTGPEDADGPMRTLPAAEWGAWLDAMQPVEPIRFVGLASPSALLFQNGRQDRLVPPADAEVYQAAGSEPKTIMWYDAGHGLNDEAVRDRMEWLAEWIGIDPSGTPSSQR